LRFDNGEIFKQSRLKIAALSRWMAVGLRRVIADSAATFNTPLPLFALSFSCLVLASFQAYTLRYAVFTAERSFSHGMLLREVGSI